MVGTQSNHFHSSSLELILHLSGSSQLCCADRCDICGMGEENCPAITNEVVKINIAMNNFWLGNWVRLILAAV